MFEDPPNEDGDFNKLAVFLMYEYLKGEKSFYWPMLDIMGICETIVDWSEKYM